MLELVDVEFCCGIIIIVIMYEGEKKKILHVKKLFFACLFVNILFIPLIGGVGSKAGSKEKMYNQGFVGFRAI